MDVSAVGSSGSIYTPGTQATGSTASAQPADGDSTTPGPGTSQVQDSDGDYKPLATAQSTSSSAVQAAITSLPAGG
jgi:hypothetical protein